MDLRHSQRGNGAGGHRPGPGGGGDRPWCWWTGHEKFFAFFAYRGPQAGAGPPGRQQASGMGVPAVLLGARQGGPTVSSLLSRARGVTGGGGAPRRGCVSACGRGQEKLGLQRPVGPSSGKERGEVKLRGSRTPEKLSAHSCGRGHGATGRPGLRVGRPATLGSERA